jgi:hypothetical protein
MPNTVAVVLIGLLMLSMEAGAKPAAKPSDTDLTAITQRGMLLAEYDSAAWQATDAVMATHPKAEASGRYIAHLTETGWVVDFGRLNEAENRFLVDYEATPDGTRFRVRSFDPVREDTGWNLAAGKAVDLATKDFGPTTRPYNIAVLPADGGSLYVYMYPAQVKAGVYPLGGDIRYRVSPDGSRITEKRQMHKSIIESVSTRADMKVETGYHTHVLSDVPEDTDVLLVLTRQPRVPELVVTQSFMYTIGVDGRIAVEDRPPAK